MVVTDKRTFRISTMSVCYAETAIKKVENVCKISERFCCLVVFKVLFNFKQN